MNLILYKMNSLLAIDDKINSHMYTACFSIYFEVHFKFEQYVTVEKTGNDNFLECF